MQTPLQTAFNHRCPACGNAPLYRGILKLVDTCAACGQHYGNEDTGDGPAFFVILIVGFLVTGLAGVVEIFLSPPLWLHAVLWIPATLLLSIWLLYVFKSYLVAMQLHVSRFEPKDPS